MSRDLAKALAAKSPGRVQIVIDACQLRTRRSLIKEDLENGSLVIVTGSKYIAGPAFAGAVLVPGAMLASFAEASPLAPGLLDYCAALDWPKSLRPLLGPDLKAEANIGLGFRWTAALEHIDQLVKIDEATEARILARFDAVARDFARYSPTASLAIDDLQRGHPCASILSLAVATSSGALLGLDGATGFYRDLKENQDSGPVCHLGQPVNLAPPPSFALHPPRPISSKPPSVWLKASPSTLPSIHAGAASKPYSRNGTASCSADISGMTGNETSNRSRHAGREDLEMPSGEEAADLDPRDWAAFRALAHEALDEAIDGIMSVRDGPAWREPTPEARAAFDAPLPTGPTPLADVLATVRESVAPYSTGNRHPRFMGWVHGAGTAHGVIAEMIAAGLNMNCGGRNHIGFDVERQIVAWMAEAMAFQSPRPAFFSPALRWRTSLPSLLPAPMPSVAAAETPALHCGGREARRLHIGRSARMRKPGFRTRRAWLLEAQENRD